MKQSYNTSHIFMDTKDRWGEEIAKRQQNNDWYDNIFGTKIMK